MTIIKHLYEPVGVNGGCPVKNCGASGIVLVGEEFVNGLNVTIYYNCSNIMCGGKFFTTHKVAVDPGIKTIPQPSSLHLLFR